MARPARYEDELQKLKGLARAAQLRYHRGYARWEGLVREDADPMQVLEAWRTCEKELKSCEEAYRKLLIFQSRRKAMHVEQSAARRAA